jgi:hypothetical protein
MSSKYAWHPPHRPSPASPSIVGRIATIGPVGKCLEIALRGLFDDGEGGDGGRSHRRTEDVDDYYDGGGGSNDIGVDGMNVNTRVINASNHLPHRDDDENDVVDDGHEGGEAARRGLPPSASSIGDDDDGRASTTNTTTEIAVIRFDDEMSRSIMESYRVAVVETNFDDHHHRLASSPSRNEDEDEDDYIDSTAFAAAPAALLVGEIDHYNRIGGQWRIVVRNAILKRRALTTLDNGMSGRSRRKRTVLDWGDEYDDDDENERIEGRKTGASSDDVGGKVNGDLSKNADHFLGTIQVLAYNDA